MNFNFSKLFLYLKSINIPTFLTFLRLFLAPFVFFMIIKNHWNLGFYLFLFAAVTDFLDGFLARYLKLETKFGACLDPIADKFLLLSVYFALTFIDLNFFKIPNWFAIFIFIKEILLVFGAFYFGFLKGIISIQPSVLGKLTTFLQIAFIIMIFVSKIFDLSFLNFSLFIYTILILNLITFFDYLSKLRGYNAN